MSSTPYHFFNLQQFRATTQAGGVSGVVLKAHGDAFFIEIEMRSGEYAVLVTARDQEPRRFKNPLRALAILRDIGIVQGHFDLAFYTPEQYNTPYQFENQKDLLAQTAVTTEKLTQHTKPDGASHQENKPAAKKQTNQTKAPRQIRLL